MLQPASPSFCVIKEVEDPVLWGERKNVKAWQNQTRFIVKENKEKYKDPNAPKRPLWDETSTRHDVDSLGETLSCLYWVVLWSRLREGMSWLLIDVERPTLNVGGSSSGAGPGPLRAEHNQQAGRQAKPYSFSLCSWLAVWIPDLTSLKWGIGTWNFEPYQPILPPVSFVCFWKAISHSNRNESRTGLLYLLLLFWTLPQIKGELPGSSLVLLSSQVLPWCYYEETWKDM